MDFTYAERMDVGHEGQLMDTNERTLISRTAEEVIAFGKPLVQGAMDRGVRMATVGDTKIVGSSVSEASAFNDEYALTESVRIATEGTQLVRTLVAVVAGDTLSVDLATGSYTTGGDIDLQGRFEDSGDADSLVRIRFDITGN